MLICRCYVIAISLVENDQLLMGNLPVAFLPVGS